MCPNEHRKRADRRRCGRLHRVVSMRATCSPGAIIRTSGRWVAPDRRISSWVITKTAAAVCESFCSFFDDDVTWMFINSSRLALVKSRAGQEAASKRKTTALTSNSSTPISLV